jgi:hypothetical protein
MAVGVFLEKSFLNAFVKWFCDAFSAFYKPPTDQRGRLKALFLALW